MISFRDYNNYPYKYNNLIRTILLSRDRTQLGSDHKDRIFPQWAAPADRIPNFDPLRVRSHHAGHYLPYARRCWYLYFEGEQRLRLRFIVRTLGGGRRVEHNLLIAVPGESGQAPVSGRSQQVRAKGTVRGDKREDRLRSAVSVKNQKSAH